MTVSKLLFSARWRLLVPVCAVIAAGCGETKPPEAPTGGTAAAEQTPATQPSHPSPPPPSTVSISDEIRSRCGISDADAYFSFDSAHLTANDHTPLDLVVKCFTKGPLAGRSVKLVGRADPRGTEEYNLTLGQSRADAVATYLSGRGLAKSQALSTSRGSMDAIGNSEAGWQHDRRVDVLLGN